MAARDNYQEESTSHNNVNTMEQFDWRSWNHRLSSTLMVGHHGVRFFFLEELRARGGNSSAKRRVAHAEAGANMLGKQFNGAAVSNGIGLSQIFHGLHQ